MKVILVDVMSLDAKLTKWNRTNIYDWTSQEDFEHFLKVKSKNNLLVMGSGTFNAVQPPLDKKTLRIVMTTQLKKYTKKSVPGQLEFTDKTPKELIASLEERGFTQLLLVGGQTIATSFLQEGLINELWLTIEPRIFGMGKALVLTKKMDLQLQLITSRILNKQGTLFLRYKIL